MNELSNGQFMTVKEVSTVLNVSERVCQLAIKKLFPEIVINGKTTLLSEYQVTALKLELQSHHNLEGTFEQSTELEMLLLDKKVNKWKDDKILFLTAENKQLTIANEIMTPKAIVYDSFMQAENSQSMFEVAKILKIGRNTLFKLLREKKILHKNNVPYQEYAKYFEVIMKPINKGGYIDNEPVTLVKPEGIEYLNKIIN